MLLGRITATGSTSGAHHGRGGHTGVLLAAQRGRRPARGRGAVRCDVVEWQLVGVNPDAVDREVLLYP